MPTAEQLLNVKLIELIHMQEQISLDLPPEEPVADGDLAYPEPIKCSLEKGE